MKAAYPVLFTETTTGVLIEVPDLEILTQGEDFANAIYMARDAIGIKGISLEDRDLRIPTPSEIDASKGVFAAEGKTIISYVDIDFDEYRRKLSQKTVRRNITLPSWLDMEARKSKINVSKVLQDALIEKLHLNN